MADFYSFSDQTDNVDSFPGGAKIEDCSDGGKQRKVITILIGKDPLAPFNNPSDISYIFSTKNIYEWIFNKRGPHRITLKRDVISKFPF